MDSIIRWTGSKRKLAARLAPVIEVADESTYYEPFAGSAAMFFKLEPECAILGDFNHELVHALRSLKEQPEKIAQGVLSLPATQEKYYEIRARDSRHLSSTSRAIRFFYLNRYCFNGVYRTNRAGHFNVPMGHKTGSPPALSEWLAAAKLLQNCEIRVGDFLDILDDVQSGDFVYLDPPYSQSRRFRGEFGYGSFSDGDLKRLLEEMCRLDSLGCRVLVSYKVCKELAALKSNWEKIHVNVGRQVAAKAASRKIAREYLIANFALPKTHHDYYCA